ncbi:helix-turn-helix domain-containing protein [Pseudomonas monteilii]|uniref:helix-turn-helix domain-containing protein n=1 Tax=Pseudomonas monteilii TaxID=76759 RepID=UPI0037FCBE2A
MIVLAVALSSVLRGDKPMEAAEALAVAVRGLRRGRNLSQEDLNSFGRSHLSRIERGEVNVTLDILTRLARVMELDAAALVLIATALQNGESFSDGLKRISKQLNRIKKSGMDVEIESLALAGKLPPGRPARADAAAKASEAKRLRNSGMPVSEIAEQLELSQVTIRRYLKTAKPETD